MKKHFSHFIKSNPKLIHFAAHSHHYWADVTKDAIIKYWDDSARFVDDKWDLIFSEKIPHAQNLLSKRLGLRSGKDIVFAPNTHELVYRILSSIKPANADSSLNILSSDSEFYSFTRQAQRLAELDNVNLKQLKINSISEFKESVLTELKVRKYDVFFVSHVFFDSGCSLGEINNFLKAVKELVPMVILDGYHAFCAINVDLSELEDDIIYLAGSYKYLGAGEGCCFAHIPECYQNLRPEYTGWFAQFGELSKSMGNEVSYSASAMRFAGSTMDFSALYKLISVLELFENESISSDVISNHVKKLQKYFISKLPDSIFSEVELILEDINDHGNFLAFNFESSKVASIHQQLKELDILTDFRGSRLRFGFSIYHDEQMIDDFFSRSCSLKF